MSAAAMARLAWTASNPAGYFDPFQLTNFDDPLVRRSYRDYQVANIRETIPRSVATTDERLTFARPRAN